MSSSPHAQSAGSTARTGTLAWAVLGVVYGDIGTSSLYTVKVFGFVMTLWFFSIGACGLLWIVRTPAILAAANPHYALAFLSQRGMHGFWVLGAVVPCIMQLCIDHGVKIGGDLSYYLSCESLVISWRSGMARWRKVLFAFLSRNAHSVTDFSSIPPGRVDELGMRVEI